MHFLREKRCTVICVFVLFVIMLVLTVFLIRSGISIDNTVRLEIFDVLYFNILLEILFISAFREKVSNTLFAYTNIVLTGGIFFLFVSGVVLAVLLFTTLISGNTSLSVFEFILEFPSVFSKFATAFIILISVLLGISNIALIRHEGFCLNNALSILVAVFYIGGAEIVNVITKYLSSITIKTEKSIIGILSVTLSNIVPLFLVLMLCYFECILLGTAVMGWRVVRARPKHDKDFIIILGCSIDKRGGLLPLLKGRVNRAIRYAWEQEIDNGKSIIYVPTGGQGPNEVISEGSAMELYLLSKGAENYEILTEKMARDTWENLSFSKNIIDGINPNSKVVISTTNYHLLRSGILARYAGLDAEGIAGDTKWYFWPNGFIREFFAIIALKRKAHLIVAIILFILSIFIGLCGKYCGL